MKKNQLSLFRKLIQKVPQSHEEQLSSSVQFPLDPALEDQFRLWLRKEMEIIKHDENNISSWKDFKVSTDLSVPELSYFVKLLCDTGIIKNANRSELMKFIAAFFSSINTSNISEGSLRKNFYNDNAAVSASIRDKLILLLNQAKKGQ